MLLARTYSRTERTWLQQYQHTLTSRPFGLLLCAIFLLWITAWHTSGIVKSAAPTQSFDLVQTYIQDSRGNGGRESPGTSLMLDIIADKLAIGWHIPEQWLGLDDRLLQPYPDLERYLDVRNPRTPAEAAQLALELCMRRNLYLQNTKIPMIVHQTWKTLDTSLWTDTTKEGVEAWLAVATGKAYPDLPRMAYIIWDDDAMDALIALYEKDLWPQYQKLPRPVEKADIFRIAVVKWFGGVVCVYDALIYT